MVTFELAKLQYDWYPFTPTWRFYFLAFFIFGLIKLLIPGLILGLILGIFDGLTPTVVSSPNATDCWSFPGPIVNTIDSLINCLVNGLIIKGPILILIGGLLFVLVLTLKKEFLCIETKDRIQWSWSKFFKYINEFKFVFLSYCLSTSLTRSLLFSLSFGLLLILFSLYDYLHSESIAAIQINHPYQRFRNSKYLLHFSIFQHWHLMHLLSKKGLLPWKIMPFLNDMVAQKMLESSDGATWRFRHKILQDHFAGKWEVMKDHLNE